MGEIAEMEARLREQMAAKIEDPTLPSAVEQSHREWREWADARGIDEKELEELCREKSVPMVLSITLGGLQSSPALVAMAMYGFQLAFEVAVKRYASSAPEGVVTDPNPPRSTLSFTKQEIGIMRRVAFAIETGTNPRHQLTDEELKKLRNLRLVCQGYLEKS